MGAAVNYIKQGKIKALAVTSRERNPALPDVPSASEALPGFENSGWFGLMAPAGTPKDVIDKIQRDSAKILLSDEFKAKLAQQGMMPVANTPSEFAAAVKEESGRWQKIIKERNLKAG
jgi:tripartite-type tricarboxylate transporter receptor subunit TctC